MALTKGITGAIGKWPADEQSFLVLPGVDTSLKVFPVAVNEAGQPTIVAGFYGSVRNIMIFFIYSTIGCMLPLSLQGRFVLSGNWDQFYDPRDDDEKKLSSNALSWLSGDPNKDGSEVKVAIRDYSKMYGHEDDSPRYCSTTVQLWRIFRMTMKCFFSYTT